MPNSLQVKVVKTDERAVLPAYATAHAAGADLCILSDVPVVIRPHETVLAHTGLSMEIPEGYAGLIFARSGLSTKRDLAPANKVGVIDSDYRGEIMVPLHNHGETAQTVMPGERIAQMLFLECGKAAFIASDALEGSERGAGGFGSTGT